MLKFAFRTLLSIGLIASQTGCSVDSGEPTAPPAGTISSGGPIITPVVPPPPLALSTKNVTIGIIGDGQVLFNGIGICTARTSPCTFSILKNSTPILSVLPTPGIAFYFWGNCSHPAGTTCHSRSTESLTITASFSPYISPEPIQALPVITLANTSVDEGSQLDFLVTLSKPGSSDLTFNYATTNGSAVAGTNYQTLAGTILMPAGLTSAHIRVNTLVDSVVSGPLTMNLNLSSPLNATLGNASAVGNINNIDVAPPEALARMNDLTGQTQLNDEISLQGSLSVSTNFCGVFATSSQGLSATNSFGVLTITDPQSLSMKFTPNVDARGDAEFTVYVCSGTQTSTAKVRILIDNPLANLQPGLAVRAAACIVCHSSIQSNVITDFGFGSPYFYGQNSNVPWDQGSIYGNQDSNWRYSSLKKIIVPHGATVSQSLKDSLVFQSDNQIQPSVVDSVANFLRWYLDVKDDGTKTQVIEHKSIYIGAPTAARLRQAANKQSSDGTIKFIPENQLSPALTNLTVMTGTRPDSSTGSFVTNDPSQEIVCNGDVLIDAPLLLNNPKINTTKGCRLYVTQSVFLQAPITYTSTSTNANLQITSAKAILSGLGWNDCGVRWRDDDPFLPDSDNHSIKGRIKNQGWTNPNTFLRSMGSSNPQEYFDDVYEQSLLIPRAQLIDASCGTSNTFSLTTTATTWVNSNILRISDTSPLKIGMLVSGAGIERGTSVSRILSSTDFQIVVGVNDSRMPTNGSQSVTFTNPRYVPLEHVLLNAPIVHNRYIGDIDGVIIAEYALMGLGTFHYRFDDRFVSVPVLPLLRSNEYLDVEISGDSVSNNYPPVSDFMYLHYPVNGFNHRVDLYPFSRKYLTKPLTYDPDGEIASISFQIDQLTPTAITNVLPAPECQVGSTIQSDDHLCRLAHSGSFYSLTFGKNFGTFKITQTVTDNLGATSSSSQIITIDQASETLFRTFFSASPLYGAAVDQSSIKYQVTDDAWNAARSTDYQYRWNVTADAVSELDMLNVNNPCAYEITGSNGEIYKFAKSVTQFFDLSLDSIYHAAACPVGDSSVPNTYKIQLKFTDWITGIVMFRSFDQLVVPTDYVTSTPTNFVLSSAVTGGGTYLTNSTGRAMYYRQADGTSSTSTCSNSCLGAWIPVTVSYAQKLTMTGAANSKFITFFERSDGSVQLNYNGRPLYYYVGDTASGMTNGHNVGGFFLKEP